MPPVSAILLSEHQCECAFVMKQSNKSANYRSFINIKLLIWIIEYNLSIITFILSLFIYACWNAWKMVTLIHSLLHGDKSILWEYITEEDVCTAASFSNRREKHQTFLLETKKKWKMKNHRSSVSLQTCGPMQSVS